MLTGGSISKKIFLSISLFFAAAVCSAQNGGNNISFDEEVWDFGTIKETGGAVSHIFSFTNTGKTPLVIERVDAPCGCTVPKYDRAPVRPSEKGNIEVSFDPQDSPGIVSKTVTVYSGNGRNITVLRIVGNVIPRPRTIEDDYSFSLCNKVRIAELYKAFQYVQHDIAESSEVELINTSKKTIQLGISTVTGDGRLHAKVTPKLKPGEKGTLTLTYDFPKSERDYGVFKNKVYLSINGVMCDMPITATTIAVDNFSDTDKENAPVCSISPVFHNFGKMKAGEKASKEFRISNKGKSPLIIRNVRPKRYTECDLKEGTVINVGESVTFIMTIGSTDRYGQIAGGVTIITNDPEQPMRDIRAGAEIEN